MDQIPSEDESTQNRIPEDGSATTSPYESSDETQADRDTEDAQTRLYSLLCDDQHMSSVRMSEAQVSSAAEFVYGDHTMRVRYLWWYVCMLMFVFVLVVFLYRLAHIVYVASIRCHPWCSSDHPPDIVDAIEVARGKK